MASEKISSSETLDSTTPQEVSEVVLESASQKDDWSKKDPQKEYIASQETIAFQKMGNPFENAHFSEPSVNDAQKNLIVASARIILWDPSRPDLKSLDAIGKNIASNQEAARNFMKRFFPNNVADRRAIEEYLGKETLDQIAQEIQGAQGSRVRKEEDVVDRIFRNLYEIVRDYGAGSDVIDDKEVFDRRAALKEKRFKNGLPQDKIVPILEKTGNIAPTKEAADMLEYLSYCSGNGLEWGVYEFSFALSGNKKGLAYMIWNFREWSDLFLELKKRKMDSLIHLLVNKRSEMLNQYFLTEEMLKNEPLDSIFERTKELWAFRSLEKARDDTGRFNVAKSDEIERIALSLVSAAHKGDKKNMEEKLGDLYEIKQDFDNFRSKYQLDMLKNMRKNTGEIEQFSNIYTSLKDFIEGVEGNSGGDGLKNIDKQFDAMKTTLYRGVRTVLTEGWEVKEFGKYLSEDFIKWKEDAELESRSIDINVDFKTLTKYLLTILSKDGDPKTKKHEILKIFGIRGPEVLQRYLAVFLRADLKNPVALQKDAEIREILGEQTYSVFRKGVLMEGEAGKKYDMQAVQLREKFRSNPGLSKLIEKIDRIQGGDSLGSQTENLESILNEINGSGLSEANKKQAWEYVSVIFHSDGEYIKDAIQDIEIKQGETENSIFSEQGGFRDIWNIVKNDPYGKIFIKDFPPMKSFSVLILDKDFSEKIDRLRAALSRKGFPINSSEEEKIRWTGNDENKQDVYERIESFLNLCSQYEAKKAANIHEKVAQIASEKGMKKEDLNTYVDSAEEDFQVEGIKTAMKELPQYGTQYSDEQIRTYIRNGWSVSDVAAAAHIPTEVQKTQSEWGISATNSQTFNSFRGLWALAPITSVEARGGGVNPVLLRALDNPYPGMTVRVSPSVAIVVESNWSIDIKDINNKKTVVEKVPSNEVVAYISAIQMFDGMGISFLNSAMKDILGKCKEKQLINLKGDTLSPGEQHAIQEFVMCSFGLTNNKEVTRALDQVDPKIRIQQIRSALEFSGKNALLQTAIDKKIYNQNTHQFDISALNITMENGTQDFFYREAQKGI